MTKVLFYFVFSNINYYFHNKNKWNYDVVTLWAGWPSAEVNSFGNDSVNSLFFKKQKQNRNQTCSNTIDCTNVITMKHIVDYHNNHKQTRWKSINRSLLAIAALRASIGHIGSLSAPTVADGLNTISALFTPYIWTVHIRFCKMWNNEKMICQLQANSMDDDDHS